jgi:hypothetical protein
VLIAMTGVKPTATREGEAPAEPPLRDASLISPAKTRGTPIDLSDGASESDPIWRNKDGIKVEASILSNRDRTTGCEPFWARAASAVFDNREWSRCDIPPSGAWLNITLPAPRKLAGIAITGSYRDEMYDNNFPPALMDYTLEMSPDGNQWKPVTPQKVVVYVPEEEGPKFHDLKDEPIKAIRIHYWRNPDGKQSQRGIQFVQLYATEESP